MCSERNSKSAAGTSESDLKREKNLLTGIPARRLAVAMLRGARDLSPALCSRFSMVTAHTKVHGQLHSHAYNTAPAIGVTRGKSVPSDEPEHGSRAGANQDHQQERCPERQRDGRGRERAKPGISCQ
jgi:hypothetical protein